MPSAPPESRFSGDLLDPSRHLNPGRARLGQQGGPTAKTLCQLQQLECSRHWGFSRVDCNGRIAVPGPLDKRVVRRRGYLRYRQKGYLVMSEQGFC